jgi:uncharacterized protein involved in response to NO
MILTVITRATCGHAGRPLIADRAKVAIYILVNLAATIRVVAAFGETWTMTLLVASAILWIAAFGLFNLSYGPMLLLTHGSGQGR